MILVLYLAPTASAQRRTLAPGILHCGFQSGGRTADEWWGPAGLLTGRRKVQVGAERTRHGRPRDPTNVLFSNEMRSILARTSIIIGYQVTIDDIATEIPFQASVAQKKEPHICGAQLASHQDFSSTKPC